MKKQISFYVDLAEWRALRLEAARLGVSITQLCRDALQPKLNALQKSGAGSQAKR